MIHEIYVLYLYLNLELLYSMKKGNKKRFNKLFHQLLFILSYIWLKHKI